MKQHPGNLQRVKTRRAVTGEAWLHAKRPRLRKSPLQSITPGVGTQIQGYEIQIPPACAELRHAISSPCSQPMYGKNRQLVTDQPNPSNPPSKNTPNHRCTVHHAPRDSHLETTTAVYEAPSGFKHTTPSNGALLLIVRVPRISHRYGLSIASISINLTLRVGL